QIDILVPMGMTSFMMKWEQRSFMNTLCGLISDDLACIAYHKPRRLAIDQHQIGTDLLIRKAVADFSCLQVRNLLQYQSERGEYNG
ncbi:MAG: hypothetical protein RSC40_08900, partial [Clostridia bacterium]